MDWMAERSSEEKVCSGMLGCPISPAVATALSKVLFLYRDMQCSVGSIIDTQFRVVHTGLLSPDQICSVVDLYEVDQVVTNDRRLEGCVRCMASSLLPLIPDVMHRGKLYMRQSAWLTFGISLQTPIEYVDFVHIETHVDFSSALDELGG